MKHRHTSNQHKSVNPTTHVNCPVTECNYRGTEDEVEDHINYMIGVVGDKDHKEQ